MQGDPVPMAGPTGSMVGVTGMGPCPRAPHSCLGPTLTRIVMRGGYLALQRTTADSLFYSSRGFGRGAVPQAAGNGLHMVPVHGAVMANARQRPSGCMQEEA